MALVFGRKNGPGEGQKTVSRSINKGADGRTYVEVTETTSTKPKTAYNNSSGKAKAGGSGKKGFGFSTTSKKTTPGKKTEVKRQFVFERMPLEPPREKERPQGKKMPLSDKSELVNEGRNKVSKMTASEVARRQVAGEGSTYEVMKKGASEGRGSSYSAQGKNMNQRSSIEPAEGNVREGRATQGSVRDKYGKKK